MLSPFRVPETTMFAVTSTAFHVVPLSSLVCNSNLNPSDKASPVFTSVFISLIDSGSVGASATPADELRTAVAFDSLFPVCAVSNFNVLGISVFSNTVLYLPRMYMNTF